ncbi:aldehyde dehydrogenase [Coprinopsis cinerea okayama7|uniref:Aldehyde dehydrogenase n=1 Tax=Coprinopsis cinerea (strain Okayama-7 / 130 / ATCC MYA-4618 / FGSC 9003) TaxID=240176 RepID=D6RMQ7_COPC7|nr:aldehyde dehydrogenase [Coprinopsis cinerea okayama7\|eukprot:XP_002911184.1 aldehyde dehydrogenase [Coprinopsis cinerea okayama7\
MALAAAINVPRLGKSIQVPTGLFINNEFRHSVDSGERIDAINPATEEVLCSVVAASEKDIDVAVAAAREAFNTTWGKNVTGWERARLLHKLADLMERDAQELAELESLNNGKPVRIARDFDIGDSIQCLRYYAGWADKITGQTLEVDNKTKIAFTRHDPIGVCGQIIPWNYPINMWAWKVAPALAVGCTIVMKPSEMTPLTALKLSELAKEAGFPPGVVNTVPSLGSVGGAALAAHKDVDKVSLELGGKSPHLVFESADLEQVLESVHIALQSEKRFPGAFWTIPIYPTAHAFHVKTRFLIYMLIAANWAALGITYNTGQDCTAGSRVYVQDTVYDRFLELLVTKVKQQVVGDGLEEKTGAGPVVSKGQYDRVWAYIESGKQEGARVLLGGKRRDSPGYYVDPTIFVDIKPEMKIVKEEIFGPVLSVGKFKTEEEAIAVANDTSYGLGAGLHSNDASQCMRVSSALEAGTVWVNQYNLLSNNVPFGGKKQSGIGRELGSYALEEYTSIKAIHWNFGEKLEWPL